MRKPFSLNLVLSAVSVLNTACGSTSNYSKSDHFDGNRFFNPTQPERQGLGDIAKMLLTMDRKPWPEKVENEPKLELNQRLINNEIAVTFVNHATVLLQFNGYNILTDPVWSERVSPFTSIGPKRAREPGIPFDDLPNIDVVLISHDHYDHMDLATLGRLIDRFQPLILVPLGDQEKIKTLGAKHVFELDWWRSRKVSDSLEITFTPTQHFSGRGLFDSNKSLWGSYVLNVDGKKIHFGGDTAYSSHFQQIANRFGPMDLSLIPIGAYEPRWFMKWVHMNPEESVQAHLDLRSKKSIAIHCGTFQLSDEAIDQPHIDLDRALKKRQLSDSEFVVLKEGQTRTFQLDDSRASRLRLPTLTNEWHWPSITHNVVEDVERKSVL